MEKLFQRFLVCIIFLFIVSTRLFCQQIDLSYVQDPKTYKLKNDYELFIQDTIESKEHKSIISLKKNNSSRIIDENFYANNLKYYPFYDGIDFDDYFLIGYYNGSYYYKLFEKQTGKIVLIYEIPDKDPVYDINNQLLIYNIDNFDGSLNRDIYIYDLKKEKKYHINNMLNEEIEKNGFWLDSFYWFNSFKIINIQPNIIELNFYGCIKPLYDENDNFFECENSNFTITIIR